MIRVRFGWRPCPSLPWADTWGWSLSRLDGRRYWGRTVRVGRLLVMVGRFLEEKS